MLVRWRVRKCVKAESSEIPEFGCEPQRKWENYNRPINQTIWGFRCSQFLAQFSSCFLSFTFLYIHITNNNILCSISFYLHLFRLPNHTRKATFWSNSLWMCLLNFSHSRKHTWWIDSLIYSLPHVFLPAWSTNKTTKHANAHKEFASPFAYRFWKIHWGWKL